MLMRLLCTLSCVVTLCACAATVERSAPPSATTSSAASLARGSGGMAVPSSVSRIAVVLVPASGIALDDNWTAFREEWRTSLGHAASARGIAAALLDREPRGVAQEEVLVRVHVNDYRYVSQARRFGLGVMSGNAHMDLSVDYLGAGNRPLGNRRFQTTSRAMQGIFSAMTPRQVAAVVDEIVGDVLR